MARKVALLSHHPSGIKIVWKETQTTTEWATLIGPKEHRVWVGTDIPVPEIPAKTITTWSSGATRATGRELARSGLLPAMTGAARCSPATAAACSSPASLGHS